MRRRIKPVKITARDAFLPDRYGEAWEKIKCEMPLNGARCDCGRPAKQRDHLIPVSKGGGHTRSNAGYICLECHEIKHPHMQRGKIRRIKIRKFGNYHL